MNASINLHREIAEKLLGPLRWASDDTGFCPCPGVNFHTTKTQPRDCRVIISGAPTVYCVHAHCVDEVKTANYDLRSEIGKASMRMSTERLHNPRHLLDFQRKAIASKRRDELEATLKRRAKATLDYVLTEFGMDMADLWESSPIRLEHPDDDWRLLLQLFEPNDVLWIGNKCDSGDPKHSMNFRTAEEWQNEPKAFANLICPATFKPGSISRCNKQVQCRKYLIVESDDLSKDETLAVFNWLRQLTRLRAIVDTAGKSLHGWFRFPDAAVLKELRLILPEFECDPKMFTSSQPCRLPGALRNGIFQKLLYLDLSHEETTE